MTYKLQYFPEQAFILIRVDGDVTLEAYREIIPDFLAMLARVDTSADILFDVRAIGHFPTSISELRKTSAAVVNPKIGWIVLLTGDKPVLKFVAIVLTQLLHSTARMRVFDSLESAITFLKDVRPGVR